uniref:Uncharacterized protein n=1 Tax=Anguilla anguilla TaxID=7936 RepID=A0A0E9VA76_ANGAN
MILQFTLASPFRPDLWGAELDMNTLFCFCL